jgi:hypothetical protein
MSVWIYRSMLSVVVLLGAGSLLVGQQACRERLACDAIVCSCWERTTQESCEQIQGAWYQCTEDATNVYQLGHAKATGHKQSMTMAVGCGVTKTFSPGKGQGSITCIWVPATSTQPGYCKCPEIIDGVWYTDPNLLCEGKAPLATCP